MMQRRDAVPSIDSSTLIEVTAAGFLAVVTLLTFVSVILRYFFAWAIPDSYDFTRLLLGILIFWGMAVASYRGDHITVDLLWSAAPPKVQRAMDVFAALGHAGRHGDLHLDVRRKGAQHPRPTMSAPSTCASRSGSITSSPGSGLPRRSLLLVLRTVRLVFAPEKLAARARRRRTIE